MTKKLDKWATTLEVAEKIYSNLMENPNYSCEDANNDFDLYNYSVIYCACCLVNDRLLLEGKDERLN